MLRVMFFLLQKTIYFKTKNYEKAYNAVSFLYMPYAHKLSKKVTRFLIRLLTSQFFIGAR